MIGRSLIALTALSIALAPAPVAAQTAGAGNTTRASAAKIPRRPDGKPDLRGWWQIGPGIAITNLLEEHPAGFGIVASKRIIVEPPDGKIPYQPWAAVERDRRKQPENSYEDPEGKCALGGVPHQYAIGRFQILQPPGYVLLLHEYIHAYRNIPLGGRPHLPANIRLWEGDSIGRWEGDTLVVDTTNFNGIPWMGIGGDFTSDAAHVVERFTMADAKTINFRVTVEDPKVFTRPLVMEYPFVRADDGPVVEWDCHETNADLEHMKNLYDQAHGGKK
jgi:hypothetical protein